jgi:Spy/CpxP family protein refolding chaperone
MCPLCKWASVLGVAALMTAPALAQQPGSAPGRPPGAGGGLPVAGSHVLLSNTGVREEVKLTGEQAEGVYAGLKKVQEKYRDEIAKLYAVPPGLSQEEGRRLIKNVADENQKVVDAVLKPEQAKRLGQIDLQAQGIEALQRESVVKALGLTDEQTQKIKDVSKKLEEDMRVLPGLSRGRPDDPTVRKLAKEAADQIPSILTPEQRKKWEEMTGKPFELYPERQP